jgi:chemotaxis protein methyltransferase CheR
MEQEVYLKIRSSVKKMLNIDLSGYKDEQMKRRLDSWIIRMGDPSWDAYFSRLTTQENELSRFRDYLTINVTEFFRDSDRWNALKVNILPGLIADIRNSKQTDRKLRIWSAGCSIGAEPYTLLMILEELSPTIGFSILATDLDRGALEKAKNGGPFRQDEVKNLNEKQLSRYFRKDFPPYFIKEEHTKKIIFQEKNLITDPYDKDFDLIVCRNVIIYFTSDVKSVLNLKFKNALRTGGILFLGGTEIISRPIEFGLKNMSISFYQKMGDV